MRVEQQNQILEALQQAAGKDVKTASGIVGGVTDFLQVVLYCMPKVFINIKNRTVCFQERFRLLSLAAVLRKHPS